MHVDIRIHTLLFLHAAKVVYEREEPGKSRGFGFVTLSSQGEVDKAIDELNETVMGFR